MPIAQAGNIVRVATDAVARILIDSSKTYRISPQEIKSNVKMGMIAIEDDDFPGSKKTYFHQEFSSNTPAFDWNATINGTHFGVLYFYVLLPWNATTPTNRAPNKTAYDIGRFDGEPNHLRQNRVASISVQLTANRTQNLPTDIPNSSYPLPANLIEFVNGFYASVSPQRGRGGVVLNWAEIEVERENNMPTIEAKARIHVISGADGNQILGVVDSDHIAAHSVALGGLNQVNNNINFFALVAPTIVTNPDGSTSFQFDVGDPERDGKVTIRRI